MVAPPSASAPGQDNAGIEVIGGDAPASPVIISVPHAGRVYPASLLAALRTSAATLAALEDRHVDAVARLARRDETLLIQRRARAWIDLNRGEDERDPHVDEGATLQAPASRSLKLRSGLGLVPRRAGRADNLWRRRFSDAEIVERIEEDHRPYHHRLATMLARARERFGVAVLLDLHSMPSLGAGGARIVLGDRSGRSAAARLVARAEAAVAATGWRVALNTPYAGGHILDRHGRPQHGVHALQVEIDRSLYLDARLDLPGPGLVRTAAAVAALAAALADEALSGLPPASHLIAAE